CFAERLLIANGQVITLLTHQDLAHRFSTDGGFYCVLNIADVDPEAICSSTVYKQIDVWLAAYLKCAQISHPWNLSHDLLDLIGFGFKDLQVSAKELDCQLIFDAA